jgi:hypothetical protein
VGVCNNLHHVFPLSRQLESLFLDVRIHGPIPTDLILYEVCWDGTMYADIEKEGFELSGEGKDMMEVVAKACAGRSRQTSQVALTFTYNRSRQAAA